MRVTINGKTKELTPSTIAELVAQYTANPKHVISELNGTIIPSERWSSTKLNEGDTLELVTFVGGG